MFPGENQLFDTVDHSIIIAKLNHYGIRGIALEWFQNQIVKFKNNLSNKEKIINVKNFRN